jgi:tetratricopeptide (TPR) repeat protein
LAAALLTGCSKKSGPNADTSSPPGVATPTAPMPPPVPQAPGPNAGAKEYVDFGEINGSRGNLDAAIEAFDTAINLDPKFAPAYYNRGYAKSLQHKFDEALENFSQAIALDPHYRDAYYQRGSLKGERGDFDGAIVDFQQVVSIDPKFAGAYYSLGHADYFLGKEDDALAQIEQSLTLDPKFSYCYYIRGLIHHAQGHRDDAKADFQKSLGLNYPFAAFWLFICESQDNHPGFARKDLTDALAKPQIFKPGDFPSGIADFLLGRLSENDLVAQAKGAQESEQADEICRAYFYAGMSRYLNGDTVGARDCLTKAIAANSTGSEEHVEARRQLAALAAP